MQWAGQFLVPPSDFLGFFSVASVWATFLMVFMLFALRDKYLLRLVPNLTRERFLVGLAIGGGLSIVCTLVLTVVSYVFFEAIVISTGAPLDPGRAQVAGLDVTPSAEHAEEHQQSTPGHIMHVLAVNSRTRGGRIAIVLALLLVVIGAGYAFTALQLSFWPSVAAMSAGIGLPEELTKAAAGLVVLYIFFDTNSLSEVQLRRVALAAFAIAGLGFGAGEALRYFGTYAREGLDFGCYGLRATWCVALHGAWTLMVGAIVIHNVSLPRHAKELNEEGKQGELFEAFVAALIPVAALHGFYDACCLYRGDWAFIAGAGSLALAALLVRLFGEK